MAEGGERSHETVVVKRNSTSAIRTDSGFRRDDVLETHNLHHQLLYNHRDLHQHFRANVSHQ